MPNVAASDRPARPALADGADVGGERLDVGLGDRLCSRRHRAIEIATRLRLEPAHLRDNVVARQAAQPWRVLAAGEVTPVAVVAVIGLGQTPSGVAARGRRRRARRRRRTLGREERGEGGHVALAQRGGDRRHLRVHAPLVAIEQQLPVQVNRHLARDRRHRGVARIAVGAVAGDTCRGRAAPGFDVGGGSESWSEKRRDEKGSNGSWGQCVEKNSSGLFYWTYGGAGPP